MPSLKTVLGSVILENPILIASGILGTTSGSMRKLYKKGAGAIITKSTSLNPKKGNLNPTVVSTPSGLLNAMGLPNPGIDSMIDEVKILIKHNIPVIGSVTGSSIEEFVKVASEFDSVGVIAVELNISCPHEKVSQIGQSCELSYEFVKAVKKEVSIPVFVKLTPNVTDIVKVAVEVEKAGADGITAINTIKGMVIDINTGYPILNNKIGGLSGPAIRPIAVRCVYEIYKSVKIPIIGVGGIENWEDTIEFILAGATAVQIGTSILKGYKIIKEIINGVKEFLIKKRKNSISEIIGLTHSL
jgi:dihydroorotate dehydrogenase (NAD+) catalytic subunit